MTAALLAIVALLALYALIVLGLLAAGRREAARALGGFIPDCVILLRRLLADRRVPRRYRALLVLLVGYLLSPIDLVPDFIPVAGQFDDAVVVGLALRVRAPRDGAPAARRALAGARVQPGGHRATRGNTYALIFTFNFIVAVWWCESVTVSDTV